MHSEFTREDYEHAARAAGLTIRWLSGKAWLHTESGVIPWAPPDDDGDTFRLMLAAKIRDLTLAIGDYVAAHTYTPGDDIRATSRKAVFFAAICKGKSMKGTP